MNKPIHTQSVAAIFLCLFSAQAFGLSPAYEPLPLNAIKPRGWIYNQITNDATTGMAGNFLKFRPQCGSGTWVNKDGSDGAAEMGGNWLDGYARMAYLTGVPGAKRKVDAFVADVLKAQEPDGYLGNYPPGDRFKRKGRELFNESRINYALLAYYELTGNKKVLDAVIRSARLTMSKYTPANRPFTFVPGDARFDPNRKPVAEDNVDDGKPAPDKDHSINGHVLMFADVCEWLFRLTNDRAYADYAKFLYDEYCNSSDIHPDEIKVSNLLNPASPYEGHGAHIAEHLRVPLFLAYTDGNEPYPQAAQSAYTKLLRYIVPAGAMCSDEGIHDFPPVPTQGYEYCATTELATSLESAVEKTGSMKYADMVERLVFNAGQGARTADGKMIAYNSAATLLAAIEDLKLGKNHNSNGRWQYSPAHQIGGSCCSANAVKLMPHYVSSMWMKTAGADGLAALLFGPSQFSATVKGVAVTIEEETSYPFSDAITFRITTAAPVTFPLRLRVPAWAGAVTVEADGASVENAPDLRVVTKPWQTGDTITVTFQNPIIASKCVGGEISLNRGPLLYVLPWPSQKTVLRKSRGGVPEFIEWDVKPLSAKTTSGYYLERTAPEAAFRAQSNRLYDRNFPWAQPSLTLTGSMRTNKNNLNSRKPVTLFPQGSTMLRFASFPQAN